MAPRRTLLAAGLAAALGTGLFAPLDAARADGFDATAYCPSSGTITAANVADLTQPNLTSFVEATGASIVDHQTWSGAWSADYDSYEFYSLATDRYSVNDYYDQHDGVAGIGEVRSYDFTTLKLTRRFNQAMVNDVMRAAAKRLGHDTVWTSETSARTKEQVIQAQVNANLGAAGYAAKVVADGSGTVTCTTSGATVGYTIAYTTGNTSHATVTFNDDGSPASVAKTYYNKSYLETYTGAVTFTYAEPDSSDLLLPGTTSVVVKPSAWRSAYAKAALTALRVYGRDTAKYNAKKAKTTAKKITAIRRGVRNEKKYLDSYYFYWSSWVPAVHFQDVSRGEKVWITDPVTHARLWITVRLTKAKKVVSADNF